MESLHGRAMTCMIYCFSLQLFGSAYGVEAFGRTLQLYRMHAQQIRSGASLRYHDYGRKERVM